MEGTIYVWQVFGEDNRAFPFENGRGGRHSTHFLTEEHWGSKKEISFFSSQRAPLGHRVLAQGGLCPN